MGSGWHIQLIDALITAMRMFMCEVLCYERIYALQKVLTMCGLCIEVDYYSVYTS